jgi:hypothetical protein
LITFELVFDKFDIRIERDEGSDINCVFGLMIGDLVKELETWKEVALFAVLDLIMTTSPYQPIKGLFIPLALHYASGTGRINIYSSPSNGRN